MTTLDPARWSEAANQVPTSLWMCDPDGLCLAVNDSYLAFRGTEIADELGEGWLIGIHADDLADCLSDWRRNLRSREPYQMKYRIRAADGAYRLILEEATPWFDPNGEFGGFAGSISDITAYASDRDELGVAELYRTTLDALHEGVVVTDGTGRILAMNEAAATMFGSSPAHFIDRNFEEMAAGQGLFDSTGALVVADQLPSALALRSGEPVTGMVLGHEPDDRTIRWFNVNSRPLRQVRTGEIFAAVTSFLDITAVKSEADNATYQAHHDSLTGLANRRGLQARVSSLLARSSDQGIDVAVAYCDMDRFKEINDTYGHSAGDALLQTVAQRIRDEVRTSDVVARIGGDEILMVLADIGGVDGALHAVTRIRDRIGEPVSIEGVELSPRVSIGVAMVRSAETFDDALRRADEAMYEAKYMGRDRVVTLDVE